MMAANMGGSRMSSCLKLYWPPSLSVYAPDDTGLCDDVGSDEAPVLLAFPHKATHIARNSQGDLLNRARLIHENRCCPICDRAAVVPVNAEPMLRSRDQMPIPGAGSLVGFACDCCGHQWSA
jgi:hypothetical protein